MAKQITLVNSSEKAIVDDDMYDFINQYTWVYENGYAVTYDFGPKVEMGWLVLKHSASRNN